ncbi:MurR/RpiR family transcriptional regulator [Ruegeria atlantica]|uniref:MurR/RpiR family transcriptional regulator n=1 Tax=Ruegeria atlantica TaxID=81569 RepID=UPI00147DCFA7|nr:MurR/RpiR family transcriptional regulator [Ruegeria atlantica]
MTDELTQKIKNGYSGFTKSEKIVAAYFLENLRSLPFENLGSIAARCDVSDMTVSRFIRSLGFKNINELKADLRASATTAKDELDDISKRRVAYFKDESGLRTSLEKELNSLCDVYALCELDIWPEIVTLLSHRTNVLIVGFQAAAGVALDFSTALKYIRPGTRYLDDCSGVFFDLFEQDPQQSCLVVVDTARYSTLGRKLIKRASLAGFPVVFISDKYESWGLEHTRYILRASSDASTYWDSRVAISAITNLLQHYVANELGTLPESRVSLSAELSADFGAFSD